MHIRIKQVRKTVGISQSAFGAKLGLSRDVINNLEQGRNKGGTPDYVIKLICQTYGVSERWLRTGEGEMFTAAPQNAIDVFAAAHPDMSALQRTIIAGVLRLTDEEQAAVLKLCQDIVSGYTTDAQKNEVGARDIDAETAAYRAELEAEAEAAAKSSALPDTADSTGNRKQA